jgi:hypothetical protein
MFSDGETAYKSSSKEARREARPASRLGTQDEGGTIL